jgi:hypothetical protein
MSPFSNLFQKQVGNLNERYKLTEATYDTFLDKFTEINDIMSRVKQTAELDDAQVKIAALSARNQQLEAENKELKLKLSNRKNAIQCTSSWSKFPVVNAEDETMIDRNARFRELSLFSFSKKELSKSLNTVEVGGQLKQLLDTNKIDYYTFANNKLRTSKANLNQLMSKPKRWVDLNEKEKRLYRRMRKWTIATCDQVEELKKSMLTRHLLRKNWRRAYENQRHQTYLLNKS